MLPRGRPAQDWTLGLKTRTANALRAVGYTSREQVEAIPARRLLVRTPNFGRDCLADLQRWLGRDAPPSPTWELR